MKTNKSSMVRNFLVGSFVSALFLMCISDLHSTTWVINVSNFQFSPASVTVTVGDTIKWQWLGGEHTTTSLTIPSGAAPWDSPLTSAGPTFFYKITVAGTYNYKCTPHFPGMQGTITANASGIIKQEGEVPDKFILQQNFPNPFNPVTKIQFGIPKRSSVKLVISDELGREVGVIVNDELDAGSYEVSWDAGSNPSGVYFYKLIAGEFEQTRKMTLVK